MTREARQPSSYICLTAPQASCCCEERDRMEARRDEDREEGRREERKRWEGKREKVEREGGSEWAVEREMEMREM